MAFLVKIGTFIIGVYILSYLKTGMGRTGKALEDDRVPLANTIGQLIAAILGGGAGLYIAKDVLINGMPLVHKIMNWGDTIITTGIQSILAP